MLPLAPLVIKFGGAVISGVAQGTGAVAVFSLVDYFTGDDPRSGQVVEVSQNVEQLLEDVVKTNVALLRLRNVPTDIYEPLNTDLT